MKKVFRIQTTSHMNAAPHQDYEVHVWLVAMLSEIAKQTETDKVNNQGKTVEVIVEILES